MNQEKVVEVLEEVKRIVDQDKSGNRLKALTQAIQALKFLASAEKELRLAVEQALPNKCLIADEPKYIKQHIDSIMKAISPIVAKLKAELEEIKTTYKNIVSEKCTGTPDELHCTCVPALRQENAKLRELLSEERIIKVMETFWTTKHKNCLVEYREYPDGGYRVSFRKEDLAKAITKGVE